MSKKRFYDLMYDVVLKAVLIIAAIICILPIINTIALSFSDNAKASAGLVTFWPLGFNLASYQKIIADNNFLHSFLVSVERVIIGGAINMILTILMAFPLSKDVRVFKRRNIYMLIVIFTMLFNAGLIPWFVVIKSLHLLDTIWALVLPCAVPVFNVILLMNFFRGVPKELEEAAIIDGAGIWYTLFKIFVPVSMPAIATITLFVVVNHWNSFFDGLVLMNSPEHYPLQTYIQQLVVQIDFTNITNIEDVKRLMLISDKTLNSAKVFVSMVPILLIYPFLQKYFITGITLGSVKG